MTRVKLDGFLEASVTSPVVTTANTRSTDVNLSRAIDRTIFACFFLSGATGLIYEVLWTRMLGLVFGNTVYAITTTICAFMTGLALGGYFFGRWIDRKQFPLFVYALLEILVGGAVLVVPLALRLSGILYTSLYPSLSNSLFLLNTYRFISAFLILLVPTFFMGGTLPVLSRFFVRSPKEISIRIGWLYALNTLGATLGTLLAGFYMISHLGIRNSQWLTVALNLLIGLIALDAHKRVIQGTERELVNRETEVLAEAGTSGLPFVARGTPSVSDSGLSAAMRPDPGVIPASNSPGHPAGISSRRIQVLFAAFMLSGFSSLLYEIAWTRALTQVIGSSTYAFSLILTVFLIGIALGSLLFSKLAAARAIRVSTFGWLEVMIGVLAFLTVPLYLKSFPAMLVLRRAFPGDFNSVVLAQLAICFLLLLLPTILFGSTLPLVAKLCTEKVAELGRSIGNLYAANTVGCILGSFLTGFILLPFLTARRTILLGVMINLAVGAVLFSLESWKRYHRMLLAIGAFGIFVVFASAGVMFYDPYLQDAGVFIYADTLNNPKGLPLEQSLHLHDIAFYRESLNANISVHKAENYIGLRTNGKTDASNQADIATQVLLGYLPAWLHPHPQKALVIGFGSGTTPAMLAQWPTVHSIKVVEIEKAVLEAAPFFDELNRQVYRDPRLQIVIDDARNFLMNTTERFDLLTSEPSNPWIAGIGNLYTKEFYRAAAARLNEDGLICQWVQIYQLNPEDVRMVIRSFGESFPFMSLWQATSGDLLLVGAKKPISFDLARLRLWMDTVPNIRTDFTDYLKIEEAAGIFTYFLLPDGPLREFAKGAHFNTDDLPLLEFRAPKSMFSDTTLLNINLLEELHSSYLPTDTRNFNASGDYLVMVETLLSRGLTDRASALLNMVRNDPFVGTEHPSGSNVPIERSPGRDSSRILFAEARLADAQRKPSEAERFFQEALKESPQDSRIQEEFGVFLCKQGRHPEAEFYLKSALLSNPGSIRALYYLEESEEALGRYEDALRDAKALAERRRKGDLKYQACASVGILYQKMGDSKNAEVWFKRSLELDRYSSVAHRRLADMYREQKRRDEAIREYEFLVRYSPTGGEAIYLNLSKLYAEGGKMKQAREIIKLGRSIFPNSANVYHNYSVLFKRGGS